MADNMSDGHHNIDSVLDVDLLDMPNLRLSKNRNAYLREWMVRNDKGRMEEDEFIPSEDNPIGRPNSHGCFSIKLLWYRYEEGEDPPAEHVHWIAEMMSDLHAKQMRQIRRCHGNSWRRTTEMFERVLGEMRR